jgi:hypothetical protein
MVAIHPSIPTKFSALQYSGVEFDTKPCSVKKRTVKVIPVDGALAGSGTEDCWALV